MGAIIMFFITNIHGEIKWNGKKIDNETYERVLSDLGQR